MPDIVLHVNTAARLQSLIERQPHAVLITGPTGMGKSTVARHIAAQLLHIEYEKLASYPYLSQIEPIAAKAIGIEAIRELEHFTALTIPGAQTINRIVIIHDAQALTGEAQNALLKTLEEPPQGTTIILTSSQTEALLPTVRSRLQTLDLIRPTTQQLETALQINVAKTTNIRHIMALSNNLPGLAFALLADDQSHPLVAAAQTARQLLQQPLFEKLSQVDKLAKNGIDCRNVLDMLLHMSRSALLTGRSNRRWQKIMAASYAAEAALGRGVQPKLLLTNLMLNL